MKTGTALKTLIIVCMVMLNLSGFAINPCPPKTPQCNNDLPIGTKCIFKGTEPSCKAYVDISTCIGGGGPQKLYNCYTAERPLYSDSEKVSNGTYTLESKLADQIFHPVDVKAKIEFTDYLSPNEGLPHKVKSELDKIEPGILVSTGTERSFFDLAFCGKCTGLVVRDISPRVKAYVDFNVLMLRLSKNREDYKSLSSTMPKNDKVAFDSRVKLIRERIEKSQSPVLTERIRNYYLEHLQDYAWVYFLMERKGYEEPQIWKTDGAYQGVRYFEDDHLFRRLQKFAKEGRIVATVGDIGDLAFLKDFTIAAIDTSNISDYIILDIRVSNGNHPRVIYTNQHANDASFMSYVHEPLNSRERNEFDTIVKHWREMGVITGNQTGMALRNMFLKPNDSVIATYSKGAFKRLIEINNDMGKDPGKYGNKKGEYGEKLHLTLDDLWIGSIKSEGKRLLEVLYSMKPDVLAKMRMSALVEKLNAGTLYHDLVIPRLPKSSAVSRIEKPERVQKNLMTCIAAIFWALTGDLKLESESVAFNIKDPQNILATFLKKYTAYAMNENIEPKSFEDYLQIAYEASIKRNLGVQSWYFIGTNLAYPRNPFGSASTHLKNVDSMQFGLDFRESDGYFNGQLLDILPHGKTHLIWAVVNTPNSVRLYMKPEAVGIGTAYDMVWHGKDFIKSLGAAGAYRGEKISGNPELVKRLTQLGVSKSNIDQQPLFQILQGIEENTKIEQNKKLELNQWLADTFEDPDVLNRLGNEVVLDNARFLPH